MGPSGQENQQYNNLSGAAGFATNTGESSITSGTNFMQDILSGDPTKIATVLAPQIKSIQDQSQQKKNTTAQFGSRSGGNTAANNAIDSGTRGNITNLIGSTTSRAADSLLSSGTNLLNSGMSGFGTAFGEANTLQQQSSAQLNDIFKSIGDVASGFATGFAGA